MSLSYRLWKLRKDWKDKRRYPIPEHLKLLPTGIKQIDKKAASLWRKKNFYDLSFLYLKLWNDLEKEDCTDINLIWTVKRNEILSYALRFFVDGIANPSELYVYFSGNHCDVEGCAPSFEQQILSMPEYIKNPDMFPCKVCTSCYRKYFCSIIVSYEDND